MPGPITSTRVTHQAIAVAGKKGAPSPVIPGYIPELLDVFHHNWDSEVSIENQWSSDITVAQSGTEERWALVDRPSRTIAVRFTGLDQTHVARIEQAMIRQLHQRLALPLYPDLVKTTAAASPGATQVSVDDTSFRRFFPGARCVIHEFSGSTVANAEVLEIAAVTATEIFFTTGLVSAHPERARVIPLMETEIELQGQMTMLTDGIGDHQIVLREVDGPGALPAWTPNWDEPFTDTYRQIPILSLPIDWAEGVSVTVRRVGEAVTRGRANTVSVAADRPRLGFTWDFTTLDRAAAHRVLRFIDSRMGRVRTFWMASPVKKHWTPTAINVNAITIQAFGRFEDLERFFDYVSIKYQDGTTIVREISTVSRTGSNLFNLALSEPIPVARAVLADIVGVSPAHHVRFDSDSYLETWITNGVMQVQTPAVEVPDKDVVIGRLSDPISELAAPSVPDLMLYLEPQVGLFNPSQQAVGQIADDIALWFDARAGQGRFLETDNPPFTGYHRTITTGVGPIRFRNETVDPNDIVAMRQGTAEPIWSNALGMTIFIGFQITGTVQRTYENLEYLVRLPNVNDDGTDVFEWTLDGVKFYEDTGRENRDHWIATPHVATPRNAPHLACLTWIPGRHARVYMDGRLVGQAPAAPVDLPSLVTERIRFFHIANGDGDTASQDDSWVSTMAIFRRGLSVDELNGVGKALTGLAGGATWEKII